MANTESAPSTEVADAIVIGSGFGGSVSAYRLAQAGRSTVVLERGRRYPPGSFARTPAEFGRNFWDPSERMYGLFDTWSFRGIEGVVSSGLGGGSLIYANVLLRKDPAWFVNHAPLPGGGYEDWAFSREDLDPHYDRVEAMLHGTPYPYTDTPKTIAMETAAGALGLSISRPPLAVTFGLDGGGPEPFRTIPEDPAYPNLHGRARMTCTLCGECDIGCNVGAKNTLDHTYLSAAAHAGADIRTLHEVRGFRRLDDGMWEVRYVVHDPADETPSQELPERRMLGRVVVLAAGTFGSTYLLLRNRLSLHGVSPALGKRFSGNGDLLTVLLNARTDPGRASVREVDGSRGPVITSAIRVGDAVDGDGSDGRGYYVEDAGYPGFVNWLIETGQLGAVAARAARFTRRVLTDRLLGAGHSNISGDLAAAIGTGATSSSSMPLLGMGRDVPDGVMTLQNGRLAVDWTLATSERYFARVRGTMEAMADVLDADFHDNPLWWTKRVVTVHPLGGAPIGRTAHDGVCDQWGEVFGSPGLFVLDGAAMPGAVGANPSLTIAALADRACDHLLGRPWTPIGGRRTSPAPRAEPPSAAVPVDPVPATGVPVSFTEWMRGSFALGIGDPLRGAANAAVGGHHMMFELTIAALDIDTFAADPRHRATATGFVTSDVLGGRLEVEQGWFNLFVHAPGERIGRLMLYRLHLRTPGGDPMTFVGYKDVHDDPGPDVVGDTTVLFVQVLEGHIPPPGPEEVLANGLLPTNDPRVIGAGVLRIEVLDFARQLSTMRSPGGTRALAEFGEVFFGALWETYAPLAGAGR